MSSRNGHRIPRRHRRPARRRSHRSRHTPIAAPVLRRPPAARRRRAPRSSRCPATGPPRQPRPTGSDPGSVEPNDAHAPSRKEIHRSSMTGVSSVTIWCRMLKDDQPGPSAARDPKGPATQGRPPPPTMRIRGLRGPACVGSIGDVGRHGGVGGARARGTRRKAGRRPPNRSQRRPLADQDAPPEPSPRARCRSPTPPAGCARARGSRPCPRRSRAG